MIKILRFALFLLSFSIINGLNSQSVEYSRLATEYPRCVKEFPPENQTATYVFSIDVSSSLQDFDTLLKENIRQFVNALPDGDRVTLIQEREPEATGFIYLPNTLISQASRHTMLTYLDAISFKNVNESDGFGMTAKTIEAIDQTGGTDLDYIFIFTDFEYYTRQNGYNINRCDWESLHKKFEAIQMGRKIVKVGLQLPYTGNHPEAIFRKKLNTIFNGVTYYPVVDQVSLANWFVDVRSNILRDRLRFVVEKAINHELKLVKFHIKPNPGGNPQQWIEGKDCRLISSFTLLTPRDLLQPSRPWIEWPFQKPSTHKATIKLAFNAKYNNEKGYNELEKLLQESTTQKVSVIVHEPPAYVSWWVGLLSLLFLLSWICWIIYIFIKKHDRIWTISVNWKDTKGKSNNLSNTFKGKFTVGNGNELANHLPVSGATWKIKIETVKNHPVFFWIRPGYYLTVLEGNLLELEYPFGGSIKILGIRKQYFLSAPKRFRGGNLFVNQDKLRFTVNMT